MAGEPPALRTAVVLLRKSSSIVVIAGAGLSVAAGVPDFRSPGAGLYALLARARLPALDGVADAQELFDLRTFTEEPHVFYALARVLYAAAGNSPASASEAGQPPPPPPPSALRPTLAHRFLAALAGTGRVRRVYTQNVDGLEAAAGVPEHALVQCHGSMDTVTCLRCRARRPATDDAFAAAVRAGVVARCTSPGCVGTPNALLKPDVVFFGEPLPPAYGATAAADAGCADLLVVVGSSLAVRPVSGLPALMPPGVPSLLINLEPLAASRRDAPTAAPAFTAELLGPADAVCEVLWRRLELPGLQQAVVAAGYAGGGGDGGMDGGGRGGVSAQGAGTPPQAGFTGGDAAAAGARVTGVAGEGSGGGDVAVVAEGPSRARFSSPLHEASLQRAREGMLSRVEMLLLAEPASSNSRPPVTTRAGRVVGRRS